MFKELQPMTKTASPKECLDVLRTHNVTDYNDYLLFNLTNKEELFYQNLAFLADEDIWTKEELTDKVLVAQTIDNDYLLANDTTVLVIPYSLNKHDSETFTSTFWDFLIQLEEKTLSSTILSVN